jgi:hypothetical protein
MKNYKLKQNRRIEKIADYIVDFLVNLKFQAKHNNFDNYLVKEGEKLGEIWKKFQTLPIDQTSAFVRAINPFIEQQKLDKINMI